MKTLFYPKLAFNGISKNKKIYIPYIVTCIGMVMINYIISFIGNDSYIASVKGGASMQTIMQFGIFVLLLFTVIFLFYTNSFLIRRRKKEFGLYNILGMGKRNIGKILLWESLILYVFTTAAGLILGILFSKVAQLILINIIGGAQSFNFEVETSSVVFTVILFAIIFFLILLNSLRQIHLSKPVELLHSDFVGEKPPKSNWILALPGLIILGIGYYLALTIEEPMETLLIFMLAAMLVLLATYLLFIAGSVVFCKMLKKNKKYYYNTKHFISVSSMVYRMKRNGAGLASICVMCTAVLIMISSTASLFIGAEDTLNTLYPRDIEINTASINDADRNIVHSTVNEILENNGTEAQNIVDVRYLPFAGYNSDNIIKFDRSSVENMDYSNLWQFCVIPLEDYNTVMNTNETLDKNEVIICILKGNYNCDTINFEGYNSLHIKKTVSGFSENFGGLMRAICPSMYIFVPNIDTMESLYNMQKEAYDTNFSIMSDIYSFNVSCDDEEQISIAEEISERLTSYREMQGTDEKEESFPASSVSSRAERHSDFYGLYGGMFFLGILLSIVCIGATVMIMYYKQITEGYEDKERFDILQKVGMTKKEITKSINSQILTVFFFPLIFAGIHTAVSFKIISKILLMFGLTNTILHIFVTIGCFIVFALFYSIVYIITSRVYYGIVSGNKK